VSKDKTKPQDDPISTGRKSEDPRSKTWFQPGNNANPRGRPKGSRNKISEEFVAALCDDFEQHGVEVIEAVRTERPADYLKIIASTVPKELNVSASSLDDLSDEDLCDALDAVRALIATAKPRKSKPLAN
jgi:hypothetical protein